MMPSPRMRLLGTLLVFGLVAAACAGSDPETGGGEEGGGDIVWALPAAFPELEAVAETWNEENPDQQVTVEWLPEGADEQRQQLSLELNAGTDLFDVMGIDVIWTGEFAENGWLEPLDDLAGDLDGVTLDGPMESATWDGQLWAVPFISGAAMLYYRTDLVDAPPETWQELRDSALEVAEQEDIFPYVAQGAQYEGMVVNYLEYLWSAGGDVFNEDVTAVEFGEGDAAMQATQFMADGIADGLYAPGFNQMQEEEARNEFQRGNAVYMRNWVYAHALLSDEEESAVADTFDVAPLPTFDGEGTISAVGGVNNAVSAFSSRKEAAREFVRWAGTDEAVQRQVGEEFRHAPAREDIYAELEGDPVFEVLAEVMPESRARPPVPEWNDISVAIQQNIFPAVNGEQDLQDAIDTVREELEAAVED